MLEISSVLFSIFKKHENDSSSAVGVCAGVVDNKHKLFRQKCDRFDSDILLVIKLLLILNQGRHAELRQLLRKIEKSLIFQCSRNYRRKKRENRFRFIAAFSGGEFSLICQNKFPRIRNMAIFFLLFELV